MKKYRNWICCNCKLIVNRQTMEEKCKCGCELIQPTEWKEVEK